MPVVSARSDRPEEYKKTGFAERLAAKTEARRALLNQKSLERQELREHEKRKKSAKKPGHEKMLAELR